MTSVFISYRRDDAGGHAGRLSDRLIARFGAGRVFMDVEDILPGQNFEEAIEQTIAKCDYMLAVVGPRWLQSVQARAAGEDFVRHEISVALARGTTVIPILVGGATMPAGDQLPPSLTAFSRCQAVEIRDNYFDGDAARIVDFLAGGAARHASLNLFGRRIPQRALIWSLTILAAALAGGWFAWPGVQQPPSFDGEWIAEMHKPGQPPYRIRIALARSDQQVIGTVRYPTGDGPILEGSVDENRLTFLTSHVPQFASEPATIRYQAEVQGDSITLTATDSSGTATGVARRAPAAGGAANAARALPSLSYGTWTLRDARDEEGKNWNNSVLQFTSQQESPDGLIVHGRFTWRLDNVLMGTEEVSGRYVERTRQVILEGTAVTDAPHERSERLAVGSYSAVLTDDERSLVEGRWGSTAQNEPGFAGDWEAVR
jgi:hypothetical protein